MDRTPPPEVREALRKEVGFGCPICRSPLLTYHHFDPPWNERQHHEPARMIALCAHHHNAADAGTYSRAHLRALKGQKYDQKDVKGVFPWTEKEILVRLGRFYLGGGTAMGPVHAAPILTLERGDDGLLLMSFTLIDSDGGMLASMNRNEWTCDPVVIHDLVVNTAGTNIRIWHAKRNVGLQMSFERLPQANFQKLLDQDAAFSRDRLDKATEKWLDSGRVDEAAKARIRDAIQRLDPLIGILPEDMGKHYRSIPESVSSIQEWSKENAADEVSNVTILNIQNLVAWNSGREIAVRNSNLWGDPVVVNTDARGGFTAVFP